MRTFQTEGVVTFPPDYNPPNRAAEYRRRADESRAKAMATSDDATRELLLADADMWERMAKWEDETHRPGLTA